MAPEWSKLLENFPNTDTQSGKWEAKPKDFPFSIPREKPGTSHSAAQQLVLQIFSPAKSVLKLILCAQSQRSVRYFSNWKM